MDLQTAGPFPGKAGIEWNRTMTMDDQTNKPGTKGLRHVIQAGSYSLKGLKAALRFEEAFRLELMAVIVLMPLGLWLGNSGAEKALLAGSLMIVLMVELLNSALEAIVDRVGTEFHTLSGRAKDLGSAAVMMSLINVVLVWGLVLWDRISG